MTDAILAELRSKGSDQTRKTLLRHGAPEPLWGVKFGDLRPMARRIGTDGSLSESLWKTGNADAMTLALLIADPGSIRSSSIDRMIRDTDYGLLLQMIADVTAKSPHRNAKWQRWQKAKSEKLLVCGYTLLASWLVSDQASVPDGVIERALHNIDHSLHGSPNLARHAMNQALIAMGIYCSSYRDTALQIADRLGKVVVDHGDTACKTPDARGYIEKALRRKSK